MFVNSDSEWAWLRRRRNWRTTVHEAGHATLALVEGRRFGDIVLERGENTNALIRDLEVRRNDDEQVRISLAGIMAVRMARRRWDTGLFSSAWDDLGHVADFLRVRPKAEPLLHWNVEATERHLRGHWHRLIGVAAALSRSRRLAFEEVFDIFRGAPANRGAFAPAGDLGRRGWGPLIGHILWRVENPQGFGSVVTKQRAGSSSEPEEAFP